jgi:Zn-finger nucleic acid-binding protein
MSEVCPKCDADLRGAEIRTEHLTAGYYGPWNGEPKFYSRTIGVEFPGVYDGILFWQCPDCGGRWHRWEEGTRQYQAAARYVDALPVVTRQST